ncbi:MAG TPA: PHP-associated domain-containing protein, partial [Deinococcales bacterium]|nr:PHP-associated domain-containing protein [Deinococcales bacterium]
RLDLHAHTEASKDCVTPLSTVPARLRARGITVQAVTDHNEIWGAQRLAEMCAGTDLTIIVGEEVSSRDGEIIGLFLRDCIPPGLSAEETVEAIRAQGGLVSLPHGFDPLKRHRLTPQARERVQGSLDIVETFNARISRPSWNRAAAEFAAERRLAAASGSDAHRVADFGEAWVDTPRRAIAKPEDLMLALREGTVMGQWTHPILAFGLKALDFARRGLTRPARAGQV